MSDTISGIEMMVRTTAPRAGQAAHLYAIAALVGPAREMTSADMPFNESISMVVPCKTQQEIDYYWKKLTSGGGKPVECGWVIDRFGVRWQIAPADFDAWNTAMNTAKKEAMMVEMWKMKKLDIKKLKAAFDSA